MRGYRVVYRYNGRDIATTMPYDPGHTVRVSVGVVDSIPPAAAPSTVHDPYAREYAPAQRPRPVNAPEPGYTYR